MSFKVPGKVYKAVLARGKTGYDYENLADCYYVTNDCLVCRISEDEDGALYRHTDLPGDGNILSIGRGCREIISHSELESLLEQHRKGLL